MIDLGQDPWKETQDPGLKFAPKRVVAPSVAHQRRSLMLQAVALERESEGDFARRACGPPFGEKGAHHRGGLAGHEQGLFGPAAQGRHDRPIGMIAGEGGDPVKADPSETHRDPFAEAALHRVG